jgi:formylglycine-generating enzyme required for sulfatase activity
MTDNKIYLETNKPYIDYDVVRVYQFLDVMKNHIDIRDEWTQLPLGGPIVFVSAKEADHYCELVGVRLPTDTEWTYYRTQAQTNSSYRVSGLWEWTSTIEDNFRVLRGGSWYGSRLNARASCRDRNDPSSRFLNAGFRVVRND